MDNSIQLFIFTDAAHHLPHIDEWLANEPNELFSIAKRWFSKFRQCGEDVNEIIHDGCPTACVSDAAFGYVNVYKSHVNIGFLPVHFFKIPTIFLKAPESECAMLN